MDEKTIIEWDGRRYKKLASDNCEGCCFYDKYADYGDKCDRPILEDFNGCKTGFVFVEVKS